MKSTSPVLKSLFCGDSAIPFSFYIRPFDVSELFQPYSFYYSLIYITILLLWFRSFNCVVKLKTFDRVKKNRSELRYLHTDWKSFCKIVTVKILEIIARFLGAKKYNLNIISAVLGASFILFFSCLSVPQKFLRCFKK